MDEPRYVIDLGSGFPVGELVGVTAVWRARTDTEAAAVLDVYDCLVERLHLGGSDAVVVDGMKVPARVVKVELTSGWTHPTVTATLDWPEPLKAPGGVDARH